MKPGSLVFVYAAEGGIYHTLIDIAHKIVSPSTYSCNLCAITYGIINENKTWKDFVRQLSVSSEFLHRDEFLKKYPGRKEELPAVFFQSEGRLELVIPAAEINRMKSVEELISAIKKLV